MNNNENISICGHNPSSKSHAFGRYIDFLFHMGLLYDHNLNIGICSQCGRKIQIPEKFYIEMPAKTCIASIFTSIFLFWELYIWHLHTQLPYVFSIPIIVISCILLWFVLMRLFAIGLLFRRDWIAIDKTVDVDKEMDTFQEKARDHKETIVRYGFLSMSFCLCILRLFWNLG